MRVLIIEDNVKLSKFIKRGLEKESYVVDVTHTGQQGLSQATFGDYDCIILDVMLPDIDGVTICHTLRKKGIGSLILMLTAKGSTADKIAGFSAGVDDYLTKPFVFVELLQRIRALLRRPKKVMEEVLHYTDLSLNTTTHTVWVKTEEIHLSTKEYIVLEYLLRNKGTTVTRTQLLDHCWGYDFDSLSNVADVCVRRIRQKLDKHNNEKYIKTVRGIGYTIDA